VLSKADGLDIGALLTLDGRDRQVLVGGEFGLALLYGDRFHTVRGSGSSDFGSVSGIVVMPSGVWLSTSSGIVHVPEREFQQVSRDPEYRVNYEVFDQVTDLPEPLATRTSGEPAAAGSDGVLWFVTTNGVARVDPRRIARNPLPPPVVIRSVIADDRAYSPHDAMVAFPALTKTIRIDYSGLSLSVPERVKFRYRLEGWESEWHDADTRRTASYTPGPGTYGFHVVASNNDGVWNEIGATLAFTVAPAWFQTLWFKALIVLSFAALLLLLYRIRVRQVAAALSARFEAQLAERTRIAQDLHDTLLQSTAAALMHVELAGGELTGDSRSTMSARDRALPSLKRATQILCDVNAEGRAAVQGLRTRSATGELAEALTQVCLDQPNGRDVGHRVTVQGSVRALRPPVSEEVYRVAHEALVNAYQHANARRINVDLAYARAWFRCVVRDDGCGIDPGVLQRGREGHWGLTGMRERAQRVGGDLEVRCVADGGTEVEFRIRGRLAYADAQRMARVPQWLTRRHSTTPRS
jgi:signal transduction histidine kinase